MAPAKRAAAAKSEALVTVTLAKVRETKNTVRFEAVEEDANIDTLYVKKAAFNGNEFPETVVLTVNAG